MNTFVFSLDPTCLAAISTSQFKKRIIFNESENIFNKGSCCYKNNHHQNFRTKLTL